MIRDLTSILELSQAKADIRARAGQAGAMECLVGDGAGLTWAFGGGTELTFPDTMFVRPVDAPGDPPQVARNPSRKDWAEGDLVQCEFMTSGPGPNMLTIIHHERIEIVPPPTEWIATFAYTHTIIPDPPTTTNVTGPSVSGTSSSTFVVNLGEVGRVTAAGRNAAGRPRARFVTCTRTRSAVATGTPAFIIATFGYFAASALAPVSDIVAISIDAPIDADGVTTAAYQNHGSGSIQFDSPVMELWEPEAHSGFETDADYLTAAEAGDLVYG